MTTRRDSHDEKTLQTKGQDHDDSIDNGCNPIIVIRLIKINNILPTNSSNNSNGDLY